ncbi:CGP-CTERM sorting domain-containing protein [Thermococcus sp. 21S9]|uniref:CGP-CTERM sorting domain-containing protein n=1 Tax=Thermococcus sp. 21S9 TaxID=1638223 RepID=UPI0016BB0849|nr:CGP-CTERM sorting domain-containing protein [Thermococcus sp. 21S9]NJE55164.1 CGP-CTERM sorting domain-containing protein [Thermococcus sp. 21S9]
MSWRLLPAVFVALLTIGLVSSSTVILAPPEGMATYPEVIAGVGNDGAGGFIVVVPFNMTPNGTPVVPGAWVGDFYPNGSLKWGENVKGAPLHPSPRIIKATANGSILLIGQSDEGNHTDVWVIKLGEDGRLLWSKDYLLNVSPGWIMTVDDIVQAGNQILIATHVDSFRGEKQVTVPVVLALDGNGKPLWAGEYRIPHGPGELYSTAIGKVRDGYYLILHDERNWYYLRLDKEGNPIGAWRVTSSLNGFFIKSALSLGDTVYFLGGSSNGTVLGAIVGNSTIWAKLYTMIPEKTCTEKSENTTILSTSAFSTEPAPALTVSENYLLFQPTVVKAFKLTCDGGLNTTYAVIKTDTMGIVESSFVAVTEGKDVKEIVPLGDFGEPEGVSASGNSFIALWRRTTASGATLHFQGFAILSNLQSKPEGSVIGTYGFRVNVMPVNVELTLGPRATWEELGVKAVDELVTVEKTKEVPVRVVTTEGSPKRSICGPGIILLLTLLVALRRRK